MRGELKSTQMLLRPQVRMNTQREVWQKAHGEIPKDWLIHILNRTNGDFRLENLAAIPRNPIHQGQLTSPYVERIRNLEKQLRLIKERQNGNNTR